MGKWRYGVVLDAGSSGTRLHVYRWLNNVAARKGASEHDLKSLPEIKTKPEWTKKIHPGVSSFAENPELVGPGHLASLLKYAQEIVPEDAIRDTPIFLLATAGMRLLGNVERDLLLNQICSYARANTDFLLPDCGAHIQVIPGVTEGLYGWIATNYLLGSFDAPNKLHLGKEHHTYGFLDMGGASAQIAFAPNATETEKHGNDLKLLRLRNVDGSSQEYRVYVTSWLEFGVHEARRRYLEALQAASGGDNIHEFPDPCLPTGLRTTLNGQSLPQDGKSVEAALLGTGNFEECLRQTYPLLDKDAPCPDEPCLLHGVHTPAIDFDVNHFIGISEYWHTTHEIFEMGHKDKAYDFKTYQDRVQAFCSQEWGAIETGIKLQKWGKKVEQESAAEVCFKSSWIINILHDGIGVPRVGLEDTKGSGHNGTKEVLSHGKSKGYLDPFQAVNKIDSTEVSWTLGKMVLYASSEVPVEVEKEVLPVGFGSNVAGIPSDFQYPSVGLLPAPQAVHGNHWHNSLFDGDSPRRVPGFILFFFIIAVAAFFLCGRGRRLKMYHKFNHWFHGKPSHPSHPKRRRFLGAKLPFFGRKAPSYERVLEDGAQDFDLGVNDSDSSDLDDNRPSSADSGSQPSKRTSNWGGSTPSLKFGLDNGSSGTIGLGITAASGGNVMDRTGLVVRTESRDHLAPMALGPTTNGRRSRTGSPTRSHKSPVMTPMAHD